MKANPRWTVRFTYNKSNLDGADIMALFLTSTAKSENCMGKLIEDTLNKKSKERDLCFATPTEEHARLLGKAGEVVSKLGLFKVRTWVAPPGVEPTVRRTSHNGKTKTSAKKATKIAKKNTGPSVPTNDPWLKQVRELVKDKDAVTAKYVLARLGVQSNRGFPAQRVSAILQKIGFSASKATSRGREYQRNSKVKGNGKTVAVVTRTKQKSGRVAIRVEKLSTARKGSGLRVRTPRAAAKKPAKKKK
jgi:hypothetical protein